MELACTIWPEYAEKLKNPQLGIAPTSRNELRHPDPVVIQETYTLNSNQTISYIEQASGLAYSLIVSNWYENSHTSSGNSDTYSGEFFTALGSCSSHLMGFQYTIYENAYDKINKHGEHNEVNSTFFELTSQNQDYESSSKPAGYSYQVFFQDPEGFLYGSTVINLLVGNDKFTWNSTGG